MENVNTNLEKAETTFALKPGRKLDPVEFRQTITNAGFTPREIFITVRGELKEEEGEVLFQPLGYEQVFALAQNEAAMKLKTQRPKEIGVQARVIGEKPPLSLEIVEWDS